MVYRLNVVINRNAPGLRMMHGDLRYGFKFEERRRQASARGRMGLLDLVEKLCRGSGFRYFLTIFLEKGK